MRTLAFFVVTGAGALLAAACGDVYADVSDGTTTTTGASTADASAVIPHDPITPCPGQRPDENTPCSARGTTCEYGTSPDLACNARLECEFVPQTGELAWGRRATQTCSVRECPKDKTIAALAGQPCDVPTVDGGPPSDADELLCPVIDGICACTTGPDGAHAHPRSWSCVKPVSPCPSARPLAGSQCFGRMACDYGSCAFKHGLKMECTEDGVWLTGGSASCE